MRTAVFTRSQIAGGAGRAAIACAVQPQDDRRGDVVGIVSTEATRNSNGPAHRHDEFPADLLPPGVLFPDDWLAERVGATYRTFDGAFQGVFTEFGAGRGARS